jgi:PEP-CTERM motif
LETAKEIVSNKSKVGSEKERKMKLQKYQKQNRKAIVVTLAIAWLIVVLGIIAMGMLADTANADAIPTATPTFEETLTEMAIIGNDITFENVTPSTLDAAINADIYAETGGRGYITTVVEYQANFYADGSAFLFQVPSGTGIGPSEITTAIATPEPASIMLVGAGLFALGWRERRAARLNRC